jgi:apolipoprotein N-acyltransferase
LSVTRRLSWLLFAWLLLFLANPGVLAEEGLALLAVLALVPYAHAARQAGRGAFWIEWLCAAIGFSAICWWSTIVWVGTLIAVALVPALHTALVGVLLRRLSPRWSLALALPAVWVAVETLRSQLEPPFGFGWMRVGHVLADAPWLLAGTRVWGVGGLSFAAAALAGAALDLWGGRRGAGVWLAGLLPVSACVLGGLLVSPPESKNGPRVLLVQPAFEQRRKMQRETGRELWEELLELTRTALARHRDERIDLVAWGETLFPWPMVEEGIEQAQENGAAPPPWSEFPTPDQVRTMRRIENDLVRGELYGKSGRRAPLLPAGASFLTGVELYVVRDGAIRRSNAAVLFDAEGRRAGQGLKLHTVPGGEQMAGLERFAWVRDTAFAVAGYIPDLVAGGRTSVLGLNYGGSQTARFGLSVCFDNSYDDPYTAPLRREPLDFHLLVSNEAWFEETFEYDQMLAFTRVAAVQTGRSFVRVTNSGVTAVVGPDGRILARLEVEGRDRMVRGSLVASVPVPAAGAAAPLTPYVRLEPYLLWVFGMLPLGLMALARSRPGYRSRPVR